MWEFLRRLFRREDKVRLAQEGTTKKRRYHRIKRDIGILSPQIPGYRTVTRDISIGGVKIELMKPIPKGSVIDVSLELETTRSTEPLQLKAEVVWVRQVAPRRWEAGLKFIYQSPEQKEEIESYLKYLMETQAQFYQGKDLP